MNTVLRTRFGALALLVICAALLLAPHATQAGSRETPWWIVTPEPEVPSRQYDSILYAEIAPRLYEILNTSNRVKVDVIGQSAGGRNMFLVTVADPQALGRLGQYMAIRQTMLKDPEKAQELIDKLGDFKVPVFINASIHGDEYPGVDAALRLIETPAFEDTPEVQAILEKVILLVNVVANPDGRVLGTRSNANSFDLNRDFITQSQPETHAMVKIMTEWNPMVVLDLHGFYYPMLIEPCTPPHNPNYEYDLYIKWAYYEALAMEAELLAQTGFLAQIPFRDDDLGWDDWPPTYTPMYGMFHGGYGHTLETAYQDERGVDAHFAAVWGALKFVVVNQEAMIHDQIEIFRRGFLDLPQLLIPDELLTETQFDQYNELTVKDFPAAYILPADTQYSQHQVARLVDFLLFNDVQVEQAVQGFILDGVSYPAGSYIIWMNQPKRGLANTILEAGLDLSDISGLTFYSPPAVWSNLLLWGVHGVVVEEFFEASSVAVKAAEPPSGSLPPGEAAAYAFEPVNLQAFQAVNALLANGDVVYRAAAPFEDGGRSFGEGTLIISNDPVLASRLTNEFALQVIALQENPADLLPLHLPAIAISGDEGLAHALEVMGFDYDSLGIIELNAGAISGYDILVNSDLGWSGLATPARKSLSSFFASGGDYLGLGAAGISFAQGAGLTSAVASRGSGNAIVHLEMAQHEPLAVGFKAQEYAFVNSPVWFTALGENENVAVSYATGDFLLSGYWPGWQSSGAAGMPAVIHSHLEARDVALIGLDVTFRGHPENMFRLLGNAIFAAQE